MSLLDNMFVKKAVFSMLSSEQRQSVDVMLKAFNDGEIDRTLMDKVVPKVSKFTPSDINRLMEIIDKEF